jgi:hypothetical protein
MNRPRALSGSRRAVAQILYEGSKTASEIADALGRPTGSLFGVITRMVADGVLIADTGEPARGTRYALAPEARELLLRDERPPPEAGMLRGRLRLLLVDAPKHMAEAQRLLSSGPTADRIAWVASTGSGWLIAFDSDSSFPVERLQTDLDRHAGATSTAVLVDEVIAGDEFQLRAEWMLTDPESA